MKKETYIHIRVKIIVILTIALLSIGLLLFGSIITVNPLFIFAGAFTFMIIATLLIPDKDERLRKAEVDSQS